MIVPVSEEGIALVQRLIKLEIESRPIPQEILEDPWFEKMAEASDLPDISIGNFITFSFIQRIKQVIFKYLSSILSESKLKALRNYFMFLDKNGDGILSI